MMSTSPDKAEFVRSMLRELVPEPDPAIPSSYILTPDTKDRLRLSLYLALLKSLPSVSHVLPGVQDANIDEALYTIARNGYSLSKAQIQETRQLAKAKQKGKQAQRGASPFGPVDALDDELQDPDSLGPEYAPERRGMPCGHLFQKGEAIYRCRDCGLDDTCVQCAPCFQASIHVREGHDIVFSVSGSTTGGCCDCGDPEAWTRDVCCQYHSENQHHVNDGMQIESSQTVDPISDAQDISGALQLAQAVESIPQNVRDPVSVAITSCLDFILTVMEHAPDETSIPTGPDVMDVISRLPSLEALPSSQNVTAVSPQDEAVSNQANCDQEMGTVQDLATSDSEAQGSQSANQGTRFSSGPLFLASSSSHAKGKARRRASSDTTQDDAPSSSMSAASRTAVYGSKTAKSVLPPKRQYAVILWNDEKHSFAQVIDTVTDATERSEHDAKGVAERVDKHGRDVIEVSNELRRLLQLGRLLGTIDLAVSVKPAYDVLAEETAHVLLSFLLDLSNCNLYLPTNQTDDAHHSLAPCPSLKPNAAALKQLIANELFSKWTPQKEIAAATMRQDFFDPNHLSKYQGLLLMDFKFWKSARVETNSLLMSLIARREVKKGISYRFAKVYPKLVETFILRDREPDHSICLMTVQLFSVPSIASMLVQSENFLYKLLSILQSIFTGQMSGASQSLILPPKPLPQGQANPQLVYVRQSRCYHVFYDIRYLLASESVQKLIVENVAAHLPFYLSTLSLFQAINPSKRAVSTHVEFESEMWITVFHISSHLGKCTKIFGEAFAHAKPAQLQAGLIETAKSILRSCYTLHQNDPENYPPIKFHNVHYGNQLQGKHAIVEFAVERQPISFHHPMHWLLAEMLKQVSVVGHQSIVEQTGASTLNHLFSPSMDENELLIVLEFPLRVCVKLAQVRCNLWVRNGFAIRSQAHHYRDISMRSMTYDQDVFLVQCGLATVQPDRFLVSMLNRFDLLDWFDGKNVTSHAVYDPGQAVFMAEEFLFLLATCLSEVSALASWSMERQIRRELVHFLALTQGTYSDVTKNIAEKHTEHAAFEKILGQVSNFRAPDGTNDFGIFELKDECYDEVQPFFFHYTRNQREKAEEVLQARQKKKLAQKNPASSVKDEDLSPTIPTQCLSEIKDGLFAGLRQTLLSDNLMRILFYAINNTRLHFTYAPDMLIDAALQITMIGLVEFGQAFADKMASCEITTMRKGADEKDNLADKEKECSLLPLLCRVELLDKLKPFRNKILWCLNKSAEVSAEAKSVVEAHYKATGRVEANEKSSSKTKLSAEETKRAAAKARQAAIMQKFSAQQKSLLNQFEAEDDDEDGEELNDTPGLDGTEGTSAPQTKKSWGSCILCQESLGLDKAFGSLAHIQPSRMMRMTPKQDAASLQQAFETPLTLDRNGPDGKRTVGSVTPSRSAVDNSRSTPAYGSFPQEDHRFGFNASTCGHLMHLHCFDTYYRSVQQRHAQQIAREHPEDLSRSEFVCPLCKSLGNVVLPVADATPPTTAKEISTAFGSNIADETPLQDWIRKINIDILKHSSKSQAADYQETDYGSGAFLPFYVEHVLNVMEKKLVLSESIDLSTMDMVELFINVLKPMSDSTKTARERYQQHTILAPQSRKMYIPEELVAYTIAMLEVTQRGITPANTDYNSNPIDKCLVSDSFNESTTNLLRSLLHCLRILALTYHAGMEGPSILRRGLLKRLLPHWGGDDAVRSPLLLRDPLTILVEVAVIYPQSLQQCTTLMYYVCLVQTVFGLAQPSIWPQAYNLGQGPGFGSPANRAFNGLKPCNVSKEDIAEARKIFPDVRWTVANIIGFVGYARGNITLGFDNLDDDTLAKMICSYTLPFLRRAAILRNVVNLDFPSRSSGGIGLAAEGQGTPGEYQRLLSLLSIPPPSVALPIRAERQTPIAGLVEGWIKHAYVPLASLFRPLPIQPAPLGTSLFGSSAFSSDNNATSASVVSSNLGRSSISSSYLHATESHPTLLLEHPHIYELAKLPTDLAVLLQDTQKRTCKKCKGVPSEPALCLFCGDIVCYQSFCCQQEEDSERGECNQHTDICGGAVGAFFKVKSNVVVLLHQGKGTFHLSPYLDSHGEVDIGLRKGRPQKLHQQRYDELRKQALSHGIANIVARKIEAAMDPGGWITF